MIGGITGLLDHDVNDPGHILGVQTVGIVHHNADALGTHKGYTIGIALGCDQIFDLGLGHGVGRQDLKGLGGLVQHGLVCVFVHGGILKHTDGIVPGLLAAEAGGGEVIILGGGGLGGGGVRLAARLIFAADQGGLAQNLGGILQRSGIAPVHIDRSADKQEHRSHHGSLFPYFFHSMSSRYDVHFTT